MIIKRVPALYKTIVIEIKRLILLELHPQKSQFDICDYRVHPNDALTKVYEHDSIKKEGKAKGIDEDGEG